jgi:hypothetical protein
MHLCAVTQFFFLKLMTNCHILDLNRQLFCKFKNLSMVKLFTLKKKHKELKKLLMPLGQLKNHCEEHSDEAIY